MSNPTTKSPYHAEALHAIGQIVQRLDEEWIGGAIEAPVDRALATYRFESERPFTAALFHEAVAGFVRHVFRYGKRPGSVLTAVEAEGEAMRLLERYEGQEARGYAAALCDAAHDGQKGIPWVLAQMAEAIKREEREKHVDCVLDRCVDPADWPLVRAITEILVEGLRAYLPPPLLEQPVQQLAPNWRDLLLTFIEVQKVPGYLENKRLILPDA